MFQVEPKKDLRNSLTVRAGVSHNGFAMISRFQPTANQGGSVSIALQANGQTRRNVAALPRVAECQLASAESVAGLLTLLRRPVRVAGVRANGLITNHYRAGARDWLVVFKQ